ncbi:galactose-1-phosphate uridylyltransferase [Methanolobus halotolerans]|uniref:Sulfate adenylyltransferase n=1 Tax=Methanolobus halotolerans TaxID=2052935 RepID=A0A4E0Q9F2_9EURY|nr:DUF4931 domain-containing protein [Methanolobus halotolerans]TGC11540.1 sulfate adenylyltransferase [Methanolobus halotolerans]
MSEIRKHYFLDEYCIIASDRGKRPSAAEARDVGRASSGCVFCQGNEDRTPPATAVYKGGEILRDGEGQRVSGWDVRCIPNMFPALSPDTEEVSSPDPEIMQGYGFHEVIVESPRHEDRLNLFSDEKMLFLMQVYRDRVMYYRSRDGVRYVSLFKNLGKKAGASLGHTHSQLIAIPFVPPSLQKEIRAIEGLDKCPYCVIVEKEIDSQRLVCRNQDFVVIAPFCSKVPYELWILPLEHVNHISGFSDRLLLSLGKCLRSAISRLDATIPELAYNYMIFQAEEPDYHFNIRIQPATSIAAGFEKNTDIHINSIPPELAVKHLLDRE